jgi:tetratricopeptide (TPR) repeat protein
VAQAREHSAVNRLALMAAAALALGSATHATPNNPLQQLHAENLRAADAQLAAAREEMPRRLAVRLRVAALNSLGRSEEALAALDSLESVLPPAERTADLRVKVLLPLGRCGEALPELDVTLDRLAQFQSRLMGAGAPAEGVLPIAGERLLAKVYCHAARREWSAAAAALGKVLDPFDPSLIDYVVAWYAVLRVQGADAVPRVERLQREPAQSQGVHALSRALALGSIDLETARRRLASVAPDALNRADGLAELLFIAALRSPDMAAAKPMLDELNALAPYGSAEWLVLRQLLLTAGAAS